MKRTMLYIVALTCLLVSSVYCAEETANAVIPLNSYTPAVYKICIDGLLFYTIDSVSGKVLTQVFEKSKAAHLPPQPKGCVGN